MSVVNVKEDWSERKNSLSADGQTARRRFTVLMSSTADGPVRARQASGVPRIGDAHPDASGMMVLNIDAQAVGNALQLFEVVVTYGVPTSGSLGSPDGDPLNEPADVQWGNATSHDAFDQDADGKPVVNSALEGFDPPVQADFDDPLLTITRNQASFDPNLLRTHKGAVNSDTFYGAAPGEAKMVDLRAQRVMVGTTVAYWKVTYQVQFRLYHPNTSAEKAWYTRVLNQGTREYRPANTNPFETIKDKNGDPVNSPVLLDGGGGQGVFGQSLKLAVGASPVWFEFKPPNFRSVAFGPLGL